MDSRRNAFQPILPVDPYSPFDHDLSLSKRPKCVENVGF